MAATGGFVAGHSGGDEVPALLSGGCFYGLLPARMAVDLAALMPDLLMPGFADGGTVSVVGPEDYHQ